MQIGIIGLFSLKIHFFCLTVYSLPYFCVKFVKNCPNEASFGQFLVFIYILIFANRYILLCKLFCNYILSYFKCVIVALLQTLKRLIISTFLLKFAYISLKNEMHCIIFQVPSFCNVLIFKLQKRYPTFHVIRTFLF